MDCSTPSSYIHYYFLEFAQIFIYWVGDAVCLILCSSLLLLPSIFPKIRVFSNESTLCIRWPKNWRFSFSNSPSNEYSGLISFRIDWFDFLQDWLVWFPSVKGTLKSFLLAAQFQSINFSTLSLLYSPAITLIHDYWKNDSIDYTDLCKQSDVSTY